MNHQDRGMEITDIETPKEINRDAREQKMFSNTSGSALDDNKCMTMVDCCLNILTLMEEAGEAISAADLKELVEKNIFEGLVTIGATPITGEDRFNAARHAPASPGFIKPGAEIEIVSPGLELEGKTLIKAKVELK